jgi:hypothetical protein
MVLDKPSREKDDGAIWSKYDLYCELWCFYCWDTVRQLYKVSHYSNLIENVYHFDCKHFKTLAR